ncbi:MAG: hypothetical protein ACRDTA_24735 [Pseudonocardiaceae bacterium]
MSGPGAGSGELAPGEPAGRDGRQPRAVRSVSGIAEDAAMRGYADAVEFVPANSPDEIRANLTSGRRSLSPFPTRCGWP